MYSASIYNSNAGTIELNGHEDLYQVISITGLNPPQAQINAVDPAGIDGTIFNSSRVLPRNIVITLRINGDVEANRLSLYSLFQPGDSVRFLYRNSNRDVYIVGVVDTNECGLFSMSEIMQVSIICPDPYFMDNDEMEASWTGMVATVDNAGDEEIGFQLTFNAGAAFFDSITLQKVDEGEILQLQGPFRANDVFEIDTTEQTVWITRSGARINGLSRIVRGSSFSQIRPGTSNFRLSGRSGSFTFSLKDPVLTFRQIYSGV